MGKFNDLINFGSIGGIVCFLISIVSFRYIRIRWKWSILVALLIGILFYLIEKYDKTKTISAILTLLALIWAIYHQEIRQIINKPMLEVTFFVQSEPHLKELAGAAYDIDSNKNIITTNFYGWFVTLQLKNNGKIIAEDTQPFLTRIAEMDGNGKWKIDEKWMPIPLKFGESKVHLLPSKTDVVSERPYFFNLGSFSNARPSGFLIDHSMINPAQREVISPPGVYCFEVIIYASKCPPVKKYLYAKFEKFTEKENMNEIKNHIKKVEMVNSPDIFK